MADQAPLTGPDFTDGVDATSLRDGETLLGHASGEAVLLARLGEDFVAIGATCSHYGGPLAEGLVEGDRVHCPWHHACFSLRTGEALLSPALSPIACWTVERRNERIVISGKVERDPLAPSYPATLDRSTFPRHVIIVGAGAAGSAAAEMLRRCAYDGKVTMVDDDTGSPYDRPNLSKDYLAGNAPEEWIPLRPSDFYKEHDIQVVRGHVAALDVVSRTLTLDDHAGITGDAILLATGASPIRLDIPGANAAHVHTLRSLGDSRSIIAAVKNAKRAVVIGGSFIGLETAASLRARASTSMSSPRSPCRSSASSARSSASSFAACTNRRASCFISDASRQRSIARRSRSTMARRSTQTSS